MGASLSAGGPRGPPFKERDIPALSGSAPLPPFAAPLLNPLLIPPSLRSGGPLPSVAQKKGGSRRGGGPLRLRSLLRPTRWTACGPLRSSRRPPIGRASLEKKATQKQTQQTPPTPRLAGGQGTAHPPPGRAAHSGHAGHRIARPGPAGWHRPSPKIDRPVRWAGGGKSYSVLNPAGGYVGFAPPALGARLATALVRRARAAAAWFPCLLCSPCLRSLRSLSVPGRPSRLLPPTCPPGPQGRTRYAELVTKRTRRLLFPPGCPILIQGVTG